jgi:putative heme-binding domain-containing protein
MGPPRPDLAAAVRERFERIFPHRNHDVTHELTQLLIHLESPRIVEQAMDLLAAATTQEEQLFYIFHLRTVKQGWTLPQREAFFTWLNRAQSSYSGGASFRLFLQKIRTEALATLSEQEKLQLSDVIKPPVMLGEAQYSSVPARSFVRSWTMQDILPKLDRLESGRSFESGRAAYAAAGCVQCHQFNGVGGASGPDLTGAGARFQPADLLEAIIFPSKVISDQYQATHIVTRKKEVFVGTIEAEDDEKVVIRPSPFATHTETVRKGDIETRRPSKLSVMPEGLVDVLTEDELLDLLAYLRSGGNPHDRAFTDSSAPASAATDASAP